MRVEKTATSCQPSSRPRRARPTPPVFPSPDGWYFLSVDKPCHRDLHQLAAPRAGKVLHLEVFGQILGTRGAPVRSFNLHCERFIQSLLSPEHHEKPDGLVAVLFFADG